MHLEFTLQDGSRERLEVGDGKSLKTELSAFLAGNYSNGWVPIGRGDAFIRYDQIVAVRAVNDGR